MRILYFGDGKWASDSLRRIAARPWTICGVVERVRPSDRALSEAAMELGLPLLRPEAVNGGEFLDLVRALAPDLNVSVSYDQVFRRPALTSAPLGSINFHAGMLPRYRGRNILNWALINGETEIGVTAHYMDEGIDTGDIILQRALPVGWTDGYGDVLARVVAAFPEIVDTAIEAVASGTVERRRQAGLPGTYFAARGDGDEWLDWSDTSRNLHNKVRAITRPAPGARTNCGGREVVIWKAFYDPEWPAYIATPGQVVGRSRDGALVKTGDSVLQVLEIQVEGGAPETPRWKVGTRLGPSPRVLGGTFEPVAGGAGRKER